MTLLTKKVSRWAMGLSIIPSLLTLTTVLANTTGHDNPSITPPAATIHSTESPFGSGVAGIGMLREDTLTLAATIAHYIHDKQHAFALEINGNPQQLRLNATIGLALAPQQRVKVTFEQLLEKTDFAFQTETLSRWVNQTAMGLGYAYYFDNEKNPLESVGMGGFVAHASSHHVPNKTWQDEQDNTQYELRHIAGSNQANLHVEATTRPWAYSRFTVGLDYDVIHKLAHYDMTHLVQHGFGSHVELTQRLLPTVKMTLGANTHPVESALNANIGWLLPVSLPMELQTSARYHYNHLTHDWESGYEVRLAVSTDKEIPHNKHHATYTDLNPQQHLALLDWTRTPAVRLSHVLATADAKLTTSSANAGSTKRTISCPATYSIRATPTQKDEQDHSTNQYIAGNWQSVVLTRKSGTSPDIQTDKFKFQQALYRQDKIAVCVYEGTSGGQEGNIVSLYNSQAGQATGEHWSPPSGEPGATCHVENATDCHFVENR